MVAKKKVAQPFSPKKRKAVDSKPPPQTNLDTSSTPSENTQLLSNGGNERGQENGHDVGDATNLVGSLPTIANKAYMGLSVQVQERIAELKSKISQLKRKVGDFNPNLVAYWNQGEHVVK